jgi:hypothetical protein
MGRNCALFSQAFILFLAGGVKEIHGGERVTPRPGKREKEHHLPSMLLAGGGAKL